MTKNVEDKIKCACTDYWLFTTAVNFFHLAWPTLFRGFTKLFIIFFFFEIQHQVILEYWVTLNFVIMLNVAKSTFLKYFHDTRCRTRIIVKHQKCSGESEVEEEKFFEKNERYIFGKKFYDKHFSLQVFSNICYAN